MDGNALQNPLKQGYHNRQNSRQFTIDQHLTNYRTVPYHQKLTS